MAPHIAVFTKNRTNPAYEAARLGADRTANRLGASTIHYVPETPDSVPEQIALIGDGSALYTAQALWTSARYRIPVIWVILNNTSYRILKQRIVAMRGLAEQADTFVGMELTDPTIDFVGLARSLGIEAQRAKTVHEATDLVAQGLKDGSSLLIDVDMDRSFKPM